MTPNQPNEVQRQVGEIQKSQAVVRTTSPVIATSSFSLPTAVEKQVRSILAERKADALHKNAKRP